jgi:hypothetical protein
MENRMKIPPPKTTFHSDAGDFPKHGIWDDDIVVDCWVWTSQVKAVGFSSYGGKRAGDQEN